MSLWKRGKQYWIDAVVNGVRYREPLGTTDWREATQAERRRLEELGKISPDLTNRRQSYGALDVKSAIDNYAVERRSQVSTRMVAYWKENAKPLAAFLGKMKLSSLTPGHLAAYQNARTEAGRAPKTINGELSVLRQVLKHGIRGYASRNSQSAQPIRPVDHREAAPRRSEPQQLVQHSLALRVALEEQGVQLARVQKNAFAEAALVHCDAFHSAFRQIVAALRALHEVELLEALALLDGLALGPLALAFVARHTSRFEHLLLVPGEPLVFARASRLHGHLHRIESESSHRLEGLSTL